MPPISAAIEKTRAAVVRRADPIFTTSPLVRIVLLCLGITLFASAAAAEDAVRAKAFDLRHRLFEIAAEGTALSEKTPPSLWRRIEAEKSLVAAFELLADQKNVPLAAEDRLGLSSLIWALGAHMRDLANNGKREIRHEREIPHTFAVYALFDRAEKAYDEVIDLVNLMERP